MSSCGPIAASMPRRPSPTVRLKTLARAMAAATVLACRASTREPSSSSLAASRHFALPEPVKSVLPARRVMGVTCRVVVVTLGDCGVAAALAQGWVEDLAHVQNTVRMPVQTRWVIFGDPSDSVHLFRLATGRPSIIQFERGGQRKMEEYTGLVGSPYTFVVDSRDSVRAVLGGNAMVTASQLGDACEGAR